jgi:hypothetical protein
LLKFTVISKSKKKLPKCVYSIATILQPYNLTYMDLINESLISTTVTSTLTADSGSTKCDWM